MFWSILRIIFTRLIIATSITTCAHVSARIPSADVQAHIDERIALDLNRGIVIGISTFNSTQFFQAGTFSETDTRPVTPDTLFELGPTSHLFTASATAVLVKEKQFSWLSAINNLLPREADAPTWEGKSLRIFDLLTHTGALPKLPLNLDPKLNRANPYAKFTRDDLYVALSRARFPYAPGYKYLYSHYGYALLGHVLELRTTKPYANILQDTLITPLSLKHTTTQPTPEHKKNLAPGHLGLTITDNWDYNGMTGDGGVYSTPRELLQFIAAHLGLIKTDLTPTLNPLQVKYLDTALDDTQMGYAWHITQKGNNPIHWLSGQTGGYSTFVGMDIVHKKGVVILSNTSNSIDEIGFFLLAPDDYPLKELPQLFPITAKKLQRYVGSYRITPEIALQVTRQGGRLYAQFTGEPKFRIYPRSRTKFDYAHGQRTLTFNISRKGEANSIAVTEKYKSLTAKRIR